MDTMGFFFSNVNGNFKFPEVESVSEITCDFCHKHLDISKIENKEKIIYLECALCKKKFKAKVKEIP